MYGLLGVGRRCHAFVRLTRPHRDRGVTILCERFSSLAAAGAGPWLPVTNTSKLRLDGGDLKVAPNRRGFDMPRVRHRLPDQLPVLDGVAGPSSRHAIPADKLAAFRMSALALGYPVHYD